MTSGDCYTMPRCTAEDSIETYMTSQLYKYIFSARVPSKSGRKPLEHPVRLHTTFV